MKNGIILRAIFEQVWLRKFYGVNVDCCLIGLDNLKISDSMFLFD